MSTDPQPREDPSHPLAYRADQTMVLFLDFHSLFVNYINAASALDRAIALRRWSLSSHIPVAHALLDASASTPATTKGKQRTESIMGTLRNDKSLFDEPEGLRCDDGSEPLFTRTPGLVSATMSDGLLDHLASRGIRSLVLCGLSTGGCVLRTACAASDAGFVVTVIEDACMDEPEVHRVLTGKILGMRAHVFKCDEFMEMWAKKT